MPSARSVLRQKVVFLDDTFLWAHKVHWAQINFHFRGEGHEGQAGCCLRSDFSFHGSCGAGRRRSDTFAVHRRSAELPSRSGGGGRHCAVPPRRSFLWRPWTAASPHGRTPAIPGRGKCAGAEACREIGAAASLFRRKFMTGEKSGRPSKARRFRRSSPKKRH